MQERYQKLLVWQKAYQFALSVYKMTERFPKEEKYGLTSQIRRASISVFANIAEGYERHYRKEYVQFLAMSKGSVGEIETYLMFARDLGYINMIEYEAQNILLQEISRLLRGLINSLR